MALAFESDGNDNTRAVILIVNIAVKINGNLIWPHERLIVVCYKDKVFPVDYFVFVESAGLRGPTTKI